MDFDALDLVALVSPRAAIVGAGVMLLAGGVVYTQIHDDPDAGIIAAAVAAGASNSELRQLRADLQRAHDEGKAAPQSYDVWYDSAYAQSRDANWSSGSFNEEYDSEAYYGE